MKKLVLNTKKAWERLDADLIPLAESIVDRCGGFGDEDEERAQEKLVQAMDDELIYSEDQWTIIRCYSTPDAPLPFVDAFVLFLDDLIDVCGVEEVDEND